MALPKLNTQTFELTVPSTDEKIKFRPFLVKEEKILLQAQEGGQSEMMDAVADVVESCTFGKVNVNALPSFDLEYIFLKIRAASIGEVIDLTVTCTDDNETTTTASLDISEIEVEKSKEHSNKIMLDKDTGIVMKYPSMDRFIESQFLSKDIKTEEVFNFISDNIDQIFQGDEVFDKTTTTPKEFRTFVEGLTSKQFEAIQKFYETMPKLTHSFKVTNPNTGVECEYTLEGLQSFFA